MVTIIIMLVFAPLWFLLCWMLPGGSMEVHPNLTSPCSSWPDTNTMAEDAVDDMYFGCSEAMATMVMKKYFHQENIGQFRDVWKRAADCANSKVKDPEDQALTKHHLQAICVYTSCRETFYVKFNEAVRKNAKNYRTGFVYHSLHFWLTSALQILSESKKCQLTYRRTRKKFSGKVNKMMRFGFFTSSSFDPALKHFGTKTCFKIRTCSGGFLKHYSVLANLEQEVLIPPYEMFKITGKKKGGDVEGLSDCEVVFLLESAGVHSSLNCRAVNY